MNVDDILSKIIELLFSFGFIKKKIGMYTNYVLGNTCCIPNYVGGGIGFLIEYADSEEVPSRISAKIVMHFRLK